MLKLSISPRNALLIMLAALLCACKNSAGVEQLNEPLLKDFGRDMLRIRSADGNETAFAVYVARTDEQMRQGLMFVRELDDRTGMFFAYPRSRKTSMWMKNTYISLDILFVKSNGEISDIYRATTPQSLESLRSSGRVRGAIELAAGSTEKYGINVGDRVLHRHFLTDNL